MLWISLIIWGRSFVKYPFLYENDCLLMFPLGWFMFCNVVEFSNESSIFIMFVSICKISKINWGGLLLISDDNRTCVEFLFFVFMYVCNNKKSIKGKVHSHLFEQFWVVLHCKEVNINI